MIHRYSDMGGVCENSSKQRMNMRSDMEDVLVLSKHLPRRDRLLIEQILRHGSSVPEAAEIFGESEAVLRRRMKSLVSRVRGPEYLLMTQLKERVPWELISSGNAVFVQGKSYRAAAAATGVSLHRVRRDVAELRALIKGIGLGLKQKGFVAPACQVHASEISHNQVSCA